MYKLIKITNTGCNVPEPMRMPFMATATCTRGTPFYVENGVYAAVHSTSKRLPTHVSLEAIKSKKELLCYQITPQMVFSVKTSGSPIAMSVGVEYLLSEDGKTLTTNKAALGDYRGAVLVAKNGAKEIGDEVFVSFR